MYSQLTAENKALANHITNLSDELTAAKAARGFQSAYCENGGSHSRQQWRGRGLQLMSI